MNTLSPPPAALSQCEGPNVELLEKLATAIEADPDSWGQGDWRTCAAAITAVGLNNGQWADPDDLGCDLLVAEPDDPTSHIVECTHGRRAVSVANRAARLLRLPPGEAERLFYEYLDWEGLQQLIDEIRTRARATRLGEDPVSPTAAGASQR